MTTRRPFTERLARACAAHPRLTVALWLLALIVGGVTFGLLNDAFRAEDDFLNEPEAKKVEVLIERRLDQAQRDTEVVIVSSPELTVDDPAFRQHVEDLAADLRALGPDDVGKVVTYYDLEAAAAARSDEEEDAGGEGAGGEDSGPVSGGDGPAVAGDASAAGDPSFLVSDDRHTTIVLVDLAGLPTDAERHVGSVIDVAGDADGDGFTVVVTGSAAWEHEAHGLAESDLQRGEIIGVPIAMIILLIVFGAVVAALVPLVLAAFAIVVALALTSLFGQTFQLSVFAINIIITMGLAVGIDYSLFIVSRFREERRRGLEKVEAIAAAAATASRAVFFSGMTVVLSLMGMLIVPFSIFPSLGGGAIAVVLAAVAAALTLLPAVLSMLGDRVNALRLPYLGRRLMPAAAGSPAMAADSTGAGDPASIGGPAANAVPAATDGPATAGGPQVDAPADNGGWWGRAARTIMRRPTVSLLLGVAVLAAVAVPLLFMERGASGVSGLPERLGVKQGLTILERDFSAGWTSPVLVAVDGPLLNPAVLGGLQRFQTALERDGRFTPIGFDTAETGTLAVVRLIQDPAPTSAEAFTAIDDLRTEIVPAAFDGTPATVYVGGATAMFADAFDMIDLYMPIVIGLVLFLSFLLLLVAFRSVIVSLVAIAMNLLSVGASYGALVLVFQYGFGADVLGFTRVTTIEAWVPLLMFCVLFGLSMDYQVFLLSRIRERWDQTHDSRESVIFGVQSTAGIITGAALIMVAVFAGLASGELVMFQQMGFGLAVAVFLDATVVRTVVAPAAIGLIGPRVWWLPRWLEWLPRIGMEGPATASSVTPDLGATGDSPGAGTGAEQGQRPTAVEAERD
jgi:RND superfamily putative drug exporter